jgi:hypothetical protein
MELLTLNADAFCRASTIIGQAWVLINRGAPLSPSDSGAIGTVIGELQRECEKLELRSALVHIIWQVILDQINSAIRKRDAKQLDTKQYAEAASHLYNVKVAWRNEVMHPKQTYTDEEAWAIFGNVKAFVTDLTALI